MAFGSEKRRERRADEEREALRAEAAGARQQGLPIYFCSLPVSTQTATISPRGSEVGPNVAVSEALALVEAQGWRLETAGYVFVQQSGLTTSMGSIGTANVNGVIQGQFTFRPA